MWLNRSKARLLAGLAGGLVFAWIYGGAKDWSALLGNSPFGSPPPEKPPEPPPLQLELRGVLVEGTVTWFNLYDGETKQSAWVKKGEQTAAYVVKDYDLTGEALLLEVRQRPVSVALKQSRMQIMAGSRRGSTAVAARGSPLPATAVVAVAPPPPAAEISRLEQVALAVRQRREARRKTG